MGPGTSKARHIPVQYDNRGNPYWVSTMSPPDDTHGQCNMVPDRIIPVIFVPGVMGSNLIEKGANRKDAITWRVDSGGSVGVWALRGAKMRKQYLRPEIMEVDTEGQLPQKGFNLPAEELKRRCWGEIAAMSYQEILVWLETNLNDFDNHKDGERLKLLDLDLKAISGEAKPTKDEIGLTYRYRFPVHACGYNWLASNKNSGHRLSNRIQEIVDRYKAEKKKVEKVIIVTHSMGGLVGRHCSEVLGRNKDILGIVHGVMPAIGAAAVYRRFKSGTEDMTAWYNAIGAATAAALGNNAADMTAVLSSAPGPTQLLPTSEYGNGWLIIKENNQTISLPTNSDPYGEIYAVRGKWWSMCEDQLINPLNEEKDSGKRQVQVDKDWHAYSDMIYRDIKPFHEAIKQKFHPNTHAFFGNSQDHRAYGTVTWQSETPSWHHDTEYDLRDATLTRQGQTKQKRAVTLPDNGANPFFDDRSRTFKISNPDEPGDGTVPHRSGIAPKSHCQSMAQVDVEHEPAYKASAGDDNLRACRFTLCATTDATHSFRSTFSRSACHHLGWLLPRGK
jgi:pimeloyl-ACP methyl ester carboxylesterase